MRGILFLAVVLSACAEVDSPNPKMVLPNDYRTAFVPVRRCGDGVEHGFIKFVVRVRAELANQYDNGPYPFPEGTLIVKEEYDSRDSQCDNLMSYTAMRKEAAGYFPAGGDWQWFSLDGYGVVLKDGKLDTCAQCHTKGCGSKNRDLTCVDK
jgi:hypothetical protein